MFLSITFFLFNESEWSWKHLIRIDYCLGKTDITENSCINIRLAFSYSKYEENVHFWMTSKYGSAISNHFWYLPWLTLVMEHSYCNFWRKIQQFSPNLKQKVCFLVCDSLPLVRAGDWEESPWRHGGNGGGVRWAYPVRDKKRETAVASLLW